jgi:hypothetical protein
MKETTNRSNQGTENIFLIVGVSLLALHFCRYCPGLFGGLIPDSGVIHRILLRLTGFPIFDGLFEAKAAALGLIVIQQIIHSREGGERPSWAVTLYFLFFGLALYFGVSLLLLREQTQTEDSVQDWLYIGVTIAGCVLTLLKTGKLLVLVKGSWNKADIFNKEGSSFPQEQRLIETDYSINLPARYYFNGKERRSWINFINTRRGVVIMGSPGSGKSWFVIENVIRQFVEKGFAMFVYDFKYPSLSLLTYNHFLKHRDRYPPNTKLIVINFDDPSRSHRINCIDPRTLGQIEDAADVSRTILLAGNKDWVNKQGDFWVESPMNFLTAAIWFLRNYEGGRYCSLPHVIELIHTAYTQLFAVLATDPDVSVLIDPFVQTFESKNMELLDGQLASLKTPLSRLASPGLYYILSGNECPLEINDPQAPKIVCLGGSAQRQQSLAPVQSLIVDRMCKMINKPGQRPSAIVCDEFSTVRAPSMITIIGTGRSNNISPVISFQDYSQMKMLYSQQEAESLLNMAGNIICGQVQGDTAKMVSDRFLKVMQKQVSRSYNSRDVSISESEHPGTAISPATLSNLSAGEFVGIVGDDPDTRIELKGFHARIINDERKIEREKRDWEELPIIQDVDQSMIEANRDRIRQEVRDLVKKVISEISEV